MQDTVRGETISEQSFTGSEANLFELATQAGQALRLSLGIGSASTQASLQARAALPSNQEAVRFYTEGQERSWAFDYIRARDLLAKAVAADPGYPLAHAALADAWNHLGYAPKARAEIELARALSGRLGPEDRLLIDGQYYATLQDRTRAIEAYRQLFTQFPDNLDYGLRLADEQRWVNPADALRTLEALRHLPLPSSDDPRIDISRPAPGSITMSSRRGLPRGVRSKKGPLRIRGCWLREPTELSVRSAMAIPPPKSVIRLERVI